MTCRAPRPGPAAALVLLALAPLALFSAPKFPYEDWNKVLSGDFLAYEKAHGNPEGSQIDYVNRYRGSLPKVPRGYAIKFFEYDKRVNKQ